MEHSKVKIRFYKQEIKKKKNDRGWETRKKVRLFQQDLNYFKNSQKMGGFSASRRFFFLQKSTGVSCKLILILNYMDHSKSYTTNIS